MSRSQLAKDFFDGIKSKKKNDLISPTDEKSISSAIELAYGDAKRTMTGIGNYDSEKETAFKNLEKAFGNYFKNPAPSTEGSFDKTHNKLCKIWCDAFSNSKSLGTYGKAQKIVNMTFKYLYCCDNGIDEDYFKYCHVPLDSFTLEWFQRECAIRGSKIIKGRISSWSSILECGDEDTEDYKTNSKTFYTYFYFQKNFRDWFLDDKTTPLDDKTTPLKEEFVNWPKIQMHLAAEAFYFAYTDITNQKDKDEFKKKSLEDKLDIIKKALS